MALGTLPGSPCVCTKICKCDIVAGDVYNNYNNNEYDVGRGKWRAEVARREEARDCAAMGVATNCVRHVTRYSNKGGPEATEGR